MLLGLLAAATTIGQEAAYEPLSAAFNALRTRDYDTAITSFRKAAVLAPRRTDIRKNLAYTLLKVGENDAARDEFGEAMRIDPADFHVALEYAFLCFEARGDDANARKAEARRIFEQVGSAASDAEIRNTAVQAFRNVDEPLKNGIARWKEALANAAPTFSAYYELAQLAEQRDELELAASSYRSAFQILPDRKSVLLDLARVDKTRGDSQGMMAALIAASRGGEPRAAELARELMPERYPYVYEFRQALELDPKNSTLRRELAYLLLSMSEKDPALRGEVEKEFREVLKSAPDDSLVKTQLNLLTRPLLENERREPVDARAMGERSYDAGFLKDALRYFTQAHEADPSDDRVTLKLGWTNNLLHDDAAALGWFRVARASGDRTIAKEADRAYRNLLPGVERFRTTVWVSPLYSSRWTDLFGYGQVKTEMRIGNLPIRPYVSARYAGDARAGTSPQGLSESAFIFSVGVAAKQWHGATAWFEAGRAVSYTRGQQWKDLRGGVSWGRSRGASLAADHGGAFLETTADSVFIGHFGNNLISYSQNKIGYTAKVAGFRAQTFWNANVTFDARRQYWANFLETGPGVRFHAPGLPAASAVTFSAIRGVYMVNDGNPRRPNFIDFRVGVWYAFTR